MSPRGPGRKRNDSCVICNEEGKLSGTCHGGFLNVLCSVPSCEMYGWSGLHISGKFLSFPPPTHLSLYKLYTYVKLSPVAYIQHLEIFLACSNRIRASYRRKFRSWNIPSCLNTPMGLAKNLITGLLTKGYLLPPLLSLFFFFLLCWFLQSLIKKHKLEIIGVIIITARGVREINGLFVCLFLTKEFYYPLENKFK